MKINKKIIILLTGLLLPIWVFSQYVTKDNYTGDFSDVNSWVNGSMPNPNGVNNDTEILGYISCNSDLVISGTVNLTITDTLIIYGDLFLENKASLTISSGAICIVYGNVTATNKLNLDFGSHFIVAGDFTASDTQTNVTFNEGAAIYILGNIDAGNLPGFNCDNSSNYIPPGSDVDCRYGDIISMEDNENNNGGIYNFFVSNDDLRGIDPVYAQLCGTSDVTISVLFTGGTNYNWYDSLGINVSESGISFTTGTPGEYFATFDYNGENITTYPCKVEISNINATINSINASCPGNSDGSIVISNPTGGSGTYEYTINGGSNWQSSESFTGLTAGFYDVRIRDTISLCEIILDGNLELLDIDNQIPAITCPDDILVNPDPGLCTASGIDLGTPITSDNCSVASITNDATEPYSLGTTVVIWTVTDNSSNITTCEQNVVVQPDEVIDVEVADLGDGCQSGETGSTTTLVWDLNKLAGTNDWTYSYTINDGTTDVDSGTDIAVSGNSTQITYEMDNETAVSKSITLTITGVMDECGSIETNETNNSDSVTLHGVPDTSEITSN